MSAKSTRSGPRHPRRAWPSPSVAVLLFAAGASAQGLTWSTLMGGDRRDAAYAVAVDAQGLVTVAGRSESTQWPYGPLNGANADVFVARLDPSQTGRAQLVWCTMLDGGGVDMAFDLAMTPDGSRVTVVGLTTSPSLPVTANAFQPTRRGLVDGFVMQLDGGGGAITYLSYLGGDGNDWVNAVELVPGYSSSRFVLAGITDSQSFPTTTGAFDTSFNGATDMFVSVLDIAQPPANQLAASTFLGGGGYEGVPFDLSTIINLTIGDVAIDFDGMNGSILVTGRTGSTAVSPFPTTPGAFRTSYAGGQHADMFVSRFNFTLDRLLYSTYLGGTGDDAAMKLAVHAGDVCIAGFTWSPGTSFPTTTGAPSRTLGGTTDGVVAVLRTAGMGPADLRYSTLVGGPAGDWLFTLLVEDSGVITAAGLSMGGFSGTPGALQPSHQPPADTWLARIDPRGNGNADVHYVSFLGGAGGSEEWAIGLAQNGDGLMTVTGITDSPTFPTTPGALQPNSNGALEAFVATLDLLPANARRYGTSTPGCRGPVWLQVNSNPAPGNAAFEVLGNGAPRSMPGAMVLGLAPPIPLPGLPVLNASLLVTPALVLPAVSDAHGAWRMPLALPASLPPGPSVYLQWVWMEPASCTLGPLSASHALGF